MITPLEKDHDAEALLILEEVIGNVGEKPIYRYHLCNGWMFTYWKAHAYLTACIAIAWKRKAYIHGTYASKVAIKALSEGETLLGWKGEGIQCGGIKRWDPEDMALRPDVFLNGVDPEIDNYGLIAGLSLWLQLEEQGLMDTGSGTNARFLFQQELAKYEQPVQSN